MRRKRHHKAGDLRDLQRVLWGMILEVEALLNENPPAERVLRCAHALAQLSGAYRGIVEVVEIEHRLSALERAAAERNGLP